MTAHMLVYENTRKIIWTLADISASLAQLAVGGRSCQLVIDMNRYMGSAIICKSMKGVREARQRQQTRHPTRIAWRKTREGGQSQTMEWRWAADYLSVRRFQSAAMMNLVQGTMLLPPVLQEGQGYEKIFKNIVFSSTGP